MPAATFQMLIDSTKEYMDAESSSRWSDTTIKAVLNSVFDAEWSQILNAAPYYTFKQQLVVTNTDGAIAFTNCGVGV